MSMAGMIPESPNGWALGFLTNPESWSTSTFFVKVGALLAAVVVSTITIGILVRGDLDLALKVPFAVFLILIGWDIVAIYGQLADVNPSLALLLTAPLILAYGVSVIEWWSGSST